MAKRGIIIANTGSPDSPTPDAVRVYLERFLSDSRICPMNPAMWNIILKAFILPRRSKASAEKYGLIWTDKGSPLTVITRSLADRLQAVADVSGSNAVIRAAMSYGNPSLHDALVTMKEEGCEEVAILPLYPQSALSTTSVVHDGAKRALAELGWHPSLKLMGDYSSNTFYLDAVARSVKAAGFDPSDDALLIAFHSVPMKDIANGDTYAETTIASAGAIAERLGAAEGSWQMGFQCRFDKSRKWLAPFTADALRKLVASDRKRKLFVVAPNFAIDCLETLYDIGIELRRSLDESSGAFRGSDLVYVPCLNDSDDHVRLICSLVGMAK